MAQMTVELKDFGLAFGRRTLLAGVNQTYRQGELVALIGRNGSGKSTMLRAMAGISPHYTGRILYGDCDLRTLKATALARKLAVVTTERIRISRFTCRDMVAMGRAPYTDWRGHLTAVDQTIIDRALEQVRMSDFASRQIDSLSDGESQRVMIAKALAQDTPVVLLDEPTSFLDIPNRHNIVKLLASMAHDSDKCVIYSTHELDIALQLSDRLSLIDPPELITGDARVIAPVAHRIFSF